MAIDVIESVTKVTRRGNGLGIQIPNEGIDQLHLKAGDSIKVRIEGNVITIRRANSRRKWSEKELLNGVIPAICGPDLIPKRAGRELV